MVDQAGTLVNAPHRSDGGRGPQSTVAYGSEIAAAATRHHLDPRLLAAVAAQETGGPGADSGRNIVGDAGHGHGVFQIDDRWHPFARTAAAMDPAANADYAAGMIESNLRRYGGDVRAALSAYNAGSPAATGTRTDWGRRPADRLCRFGATPLRSARLGAARAAGRTARAAGDHRGRLVRPHRDAARRLALPQICPGYRPLPQLDQRDRDLAPSSVYSDDGGLD